MNKVSYEILEFSYSTISELYEMWDDKLEGVALNKLKGFQRPWTFKQLRKHCPVVNGKNVLSIGEGLDTSAKILSENYGANVYVLDKYESDEGLDATRYRYGKTVDDLQRENPKINYINGLVGIPEQHRLPSNFFDCVYSISVLEHVPRNNISNAFVDMDRMLKLNGIQIHTIDTPVDYGDNWEFYRKISRSIGDPNSMKDVEEVTLERIKSDPLTLYETSEIFKLYWFPNKDRREIKYERWTSMNMVLRKR